MNIAVKKHGFMRRFRREGSAFDKSKTVTLHFLPSSICSPFAFPVPRNVYNHALVRALQQPPSVESDKITNPAAYIRRVGIIRARSASPIQQLRKVTPSKRVNSNNTAIDHL
jgi:hypothetical protein